MQTLLARSLSCLRSYRPLGHFVSFSFYHTESLLNKEYIYIERERTRAQNKRTSIDAICLFFWFNNKNRNKKKKSSANQKKNELDNLNYFTVLTKKKKMMMT